MSKTIPERLQKIYRQIAKLIQEVDDELESIDSYIENNDFPVQSKNDLDSVSTELHQISRSLLADQAVLRGSIKRLSSFYDKKDQDE